MMPALLTRMSSGLSQASVKAFTDLRSDSSSALMSMATLPADRRSSAATGSATSTRRTASVTVAPAPAKARAVSRPIPPAPPVTIAFRPVRSTPAMTSAAVDWNPKGVVKRVIPSEIAIPGRPVPLNSYETVRRWALKFGGIIARNLRRGRPRPEGRGHLDEVFVSINGRQLYVWRAVDSEGEVLDILVQPRRHRKAALKLMRKLPLFPFSP